MWFAYLLPSNHPSLGSDDAEGLSVFFINGGRPLLVAPLREPIENLARDSDGDTSILKLVMENKKL